MADKYTLISIIESKVYLYKLTGILSINLALPK